VELVVGAVIVLVVLIAVVLRIAYRDRGQSVLRVGPYEPAGPDDLDEPLPGRPSGTRKIRWWLGGGGGSGGAGAAGTGD
jgi:hypothetical protein